jgi:hypothetical protein
MFSRTSQHIYCTNTVQTLQSKAELCLQELHKLLLLVQLHNSTAHLLYKYCKNCTVYSWTVLTVITHNLLLHVQLHITAYLLYKYSTDCTVYSCTVLTAIIHKLLLHVQLHNIAHLLYKYCTNCTVYNWSVLTAITHKHLLHVQLPNTTQSLQLMPSEVQSKQLFHITPVSVRIHSVMSLDRTFQINTQPHSTVSPVHTATKHTQLFLCSELHVWTINTEIRSFKITLLAVSVAW